jgi:hypothetical protein
MPTAFKLVGVEVFDGWFSAMPLGAVQLSSMAYTSFLSRRTPKLIRASDPEILAVGFVRSGAHVIEQNRNHAPLRPSELRLSPPTPCTPSASMPPICLGGRPTTS